MQPTRLDKEQKQNSSDTYHIQAVAVN